MEYELTGVGFAEGQVLAELPPSVAGVPTASDGGGALVVVRAGRRAVSSLGESTPGFDGGSLVEHAARLNRALADFFGQPNDDHRVFLRRNPYRGGAVALSMLDGVVGGGMGHPSGGI